MKSLVSALIIMLGNTFSHQASASPLMSPGDRVALVAPASAATGPALDHAIANLKALGLEPVTDYIPTGSYGYLAAADETRAQMIIDAAQDESIKALWAIRGGYGSMRILESLTQATPKILIGYSDITAPLNFLVDHGWTAIHGPVAGERWDAASTESIRRLLFEQGDPTGFSTTAGKTLVHGNAKGEIVGGNLTLITSMIGTDFELDINGKVLVLEEVSERPRRIDRMLLQLHQHYDLNSAAAIVLGHFTDCEPKSGDPDFSLEETLALAFEPINIPVASGFAIGHDLPNLAFRVGHHAEIDFNEQFRSIRFTQLN